MRIIAGKCRGKKLFTPTDKSIRPTADRAREAVFSILQSRLPAPLSGYDLLDIFSGTGAFGLEAASRGAKTVTFVDRDIALTRKNAAACGLTGLKFIEKDARKLPPSSQKYNLVFMDPPYNTGQIYPTLENLIQNKWLTDDVLIIAETARLEVLELPQTLRIIGARFYGAARITFIKFNREL